MSDPFADPIIDTPAPGREPETDLLAGLNEPQREAVMHVDGPLLVLAGPGSGKTRVITCRIAHLVRRIGIAPWNILAITFTNKAAAEMKERVIAMLGPRTAERVTLCTFHSLCARLLRRYADRLQLPSGYSIYDSADQKAAMAQAIKELELSRDNFTPATLLARISQAKNELMDHDAFEAQAGDFATRQVAKIYHRYAAILERHKALDFDDLMLRTVQLMREHPDVLAALREQFQYLLIDEYQDTNHAQFVIANSLAAGHRNLCATGDPDQSIYGWRGANVRNILEFERYYSDAKVVRLEENYRSTGLILQAADGLIRHNTRRHHKELYTQLPGGDAVQIVGCDDEQDEARQVVEACRVRHDEQGMAWSDMAVFYRINSLSRVLEDAFRSAGIPHQIARGTAFYDRREIKDVVAYLRAIVNPADEVNLLRIINTPTRGISDSTCKTLQALAVQEGAGVNGILHQIERYTVLNSRAIKACRRFERLLHGWRVAAGLAEPDQDHSAPSMQPHLSEFVRVLLESSTLADHYRNDKSDPDQERLHNLGEFVNFAAQFETERDQAIALQQDTADLPDVLAVTEDGSLAGLLQAFLERIALISDVDSVDNSHGAVTLMTLHTAKGLEFPFVSMVGLEDGLLPHHRARGDHKEMEEERRLCFVGMTRAMRHLCLSHVRRRTVFGTAQAAIASPFLRELPREAIAHVAREEPSLLDASPTHPLAEKLGRGTLVRHPQFGLGRVLLVDIQSGHTRVRVDFNQRGAKTLILEYARLEIVQAPKHDDPSIEYDTLDEPF